MRPKPQAQELLRHRRERQIARGASLRAEWPLVLSPGSGGQVLSIELLDTLVWAITPGGGIPARTGTLPDITPGMAMSQLLREKPDGSFTGGLFVKTFNLFVQSAPGGRLAAFIPRRSRLFLIGWECPPPA